MPQAAVVRVSKQRTQEQWSDVMTQFGQSGQRVSAYCKQIGVSQANFYRWRAVLSGNKPASIVAVAKRKSARVNHGFVDLGALGDGAEMPTKVDSLAISERINVRVELGGGVVLQITRN